MYLSDGQNYTSLLSEQNHMCPEAHYCLNNPNVSLKELFFPPLENVCDYLLSW